MNMTANKKPSKRKLLEAMLVLGLPIIVAVNLQTVTSTDFYDNNPDCRVLVACDEGLQGPKDYRLYKGWPIGVETYNSNDDGQDSSKLPFVANVVMITGAIYSVVATSVYVRRKFFNQAADGSKLK